MEAEVEVGEGGGVPPVASSRRPSLAAVTGMVFIALGMVAGVARLHDNSFLTHLATGRLIRADGIPRVDPYSFTAPGEPWVVQSWLPSWIYASLEAWWGLDAVRVLTGLLCAAIAGIMWTSAREARSLLVRLVVVAVGIVTIVGFWAERPLLVGLVGVGLTVLACDRHLDPRWLLPMGWIWVSSHGSFPLGLGVVLVLLVGRWLDDRDRPEAELRALTWLGGGIALGAVNPLGPRLLWFPVELLGRSEFLREFVKEWRSPDLSSGSERAFLLLFVLSVAALVLRPSWRTALAVAVFVPAALLSRRNIPVAALVLVPMVARSLPAVGSVTGAERRSANTLLLGVVVAVGLLTAGAVLAQPSTALGGYPVDEVARLEDEGLIGPGTEARLLAPELVGNLLTARFGPDARVFVDDRFDMYPMDVLDDYARLHRLDADPTPLLERYEIDLVLWPSDAPLDHWLGEADGWTPGPEDDDWVLYCRDDSPAVVACA